MAKSTGNGRKILIAHKLHSLSENKKVQSKNGNPHIRVKFKARKINYKNVKNHHHPRSAEHPQLRLTT